VFLEVIRDYYNGTAWANRRIIDCAATLSSDDLRRADGPDNWSIRDSLVHVISAQALWLSRWQGNPIPGLWDPEEFPDVASIRQRWEEVEAETQAFLDSMTEEDLGRESSYVNLKGERRSHRLAKQLIHQANHSTYHRGEIASLLTRYGASPGEVDYIRYLDIA
jgi:uncharacterized damage-inducible protein DinB